MARLRSHLSYANVVSTLCLFILLGGTSYAALTITGNNVEDGSLSGNDIRNRSITTSDILPGTINSRDVGWGSLNGGDIADGSLLSKDFEAGQLPAGPQGSKGDTGATGAKGDTGATGARGLEGPAGTARGYARVNADGTLDTANSMNVDRTLKYATGAYCVHFTFGVPDNLIATLYQPSTLHFSRGGEISAWDGSCSGFDGSYNAQVRTADSAGSPEDRAFYVVGN